MGVLKDQMISEMRLRGYAEKTIKCYTSCVQTLARHFMRSPKSIERDDIEAFFRELRVEKKSVATIHIYYEALKYFYRMHNQAYKLPLLSFRNINNRTPVILSKEEVHRMLQRCQSLKYKTILTVIYSAGLRISESTNLTVSDLDFARKTIHIRSSKNNKGRYTILADETIALLRQYLNVYAPVNHLFYGKDLLGRLSNDCIQRFFKGHVKECGLHPSTHVHTLRHCFATHLLEDGTNIFYIMKLLGHSNIQTTMIYLHLQSPDALNIKSPIDSMRPLSATGEREGDILTLESA